MDLDVVALELSRYRLGQLDGTGSITVDAHGVGDDFYVLAALGLHLTFGDSPDYPISNLVGIQLLGHASGKDDLPFVVVLAVGVEFRHHRLVHLLCQLVSYRRSHTEEEKARVDALDCLDDGPG